MLPGRIGRDGQVRSGRHAEFTNDRTDGGGGSDGPDRARPYTSKICFSCSRTSRELHVKRLLPTKSYSWSVFTPTLFSAHSTATIISAEGEREPPSAHPPLASSRKGPLTPQQHFFPSQLAALYRKASSSASLATSMLTPDSPDLIGRGSVGGYFPANAAAGQPTEGCGHSPGTEGVCFMCLTQSMDSSAVIQRPVSPPQSPRAPLPRRFPRQSSSADLAEPPRPSSPPFLPAIPTALAVSTGSFSSTTTKKSVRFEEYCTVYETWAKDDYPSRSMSLNSSGSFTATNEDNEEEDDDEADAYAAFGCKTKKTVPPLETKDLYTKLAWLAGARAMASPTSTTNGPASPTGP